jgi:hypothetical protein
MGQTIPIAAVSSSNVLLEAVAAFRRSQHLCLIEHVRRSCGDVVVY